MSHRRVTCIKPLSGKKLFNLVIHVKTHKEFYRKHFEVEAAQLLNIQAQRLHFIQCCTAIVTIDGNPFTTLSKAGFINLNAEKLQLLTSAGYGEGLGAPHHRAIKDQIKYLSAEIINQIKSEVKGKLVSLMVDTATKYQRSILRVSLQFHLDSSIALRSIGMVHLKSSHTAHYIAEKIFDQLKLFEIKVSQIISITTDNASNMTAMINRCNQIYVEECVYSNASDDSADECDYYFEDIDEIDNSGSEDKAENATQLDDNAEFENEMQHHFSLTSKADVTALINNALDEVEIGEPSEETPTTGFETLLHDLKEIVAGQTVNINGIRCAVHTLQLAVINALKDSDFEILIRLCRVVCKQLRTNKTIFELRENKIHFVTPRIDCVTRWNSTYAMVNIIIYFNYYLSRIQRLHFFTATGVD